jgi:hypothetical protein
VQWIPWRWSAGGCAIQGSPGGGSIESFLWRGSREWVPFQGVPWRGWPGWLPYRVHLEGIPGMRRLEGSPFRGSPGVSTLLCVHRRGPLVGSTVGLLWRGSPGKALEVVLQMGPMERIPGYARLVSTPGGLPRGIPCGVPRLFPLEGTPRGGPLEGVPWSGYTGEGPFVGFPWAHTWRRSHGGCPLGVDLYWVQWRATLDGTPDCGHLQPVLSVCPRRLFSQYHGLE